jgi:hypothetical protein
MEGGVAVARGLTVAQERPVDHGDAIRASTSAMPGARIARLLVDQVQEVHHHDQIRRVLPRRPAGLRHVERAGRLDVFRALGGDPRGDGGALPRVGIAWVHQGARASRRRSGSHARRCPTRSPARDRGAGRDAGVRARWRRGCAAPRAPSAWVVRTRRSRRSAPPGPQPIGAKRRHDVRRQAGSRPAIRSATSRLAAGAVWKP